ncbi:hypothetical protein LY76DRAFT_604302 [Colletotrichum caudatum]|nr:hypothetical protein LY76DRAFT_604302 [Colletotrichum caudatum]
MTMVMGSFNGNRANFKAKVSRQSRNDEFNNLAAALERRKLNPNVPDSVNSLGRTAESRAVPLRPMPGDADPYWDDLESCGWQQEQTQKFLSSGWELARNRSCISSKTIHEASDSSRQREYHDPCPRRRDRRSGLPHSSVDRGEPTQEKRIAEVPDSEASDDTGPIASDESLIVLSPTKTDRVAMRTNSEAAANKAQTSSAVNAAATEARVSHAPNAAKNDVELGKLMVQDLGKAAGVWVGYSERLRIWNNTAIEACETREFRRKLKNFLAKNANFLDKYDRHNLLRDKEHMLALAQNITLLDEVLLEYQAPGPETLADVPVWRTMAKVTLAEAEDRLVAAQEGLDSMEWQVDKFYPKWFQK